jgi:hypothetical protein
MNLSKKSFPLSSVWREDDRTLNHRSTERDPGKGIRDSWSILLKSRHTVQVSRRREDRAFSSILEPCAVHRALCTT